MIQNQEYIQEFVDEAKVHVEQVEASLLKKGEAFNEENINTIFRSVHSIKGTAGFFGLINIVSLAHTMENIFGEARSGGLKLGEEQLDVLLTANDILKEMIESVLLSETFDLIKIQTELLEILNNQGTTNNSQAKKDELQIAFEMDNLFNLEGANGVLIKDGIIHGHHIFELKFHMNGDLLSYIDGPIKLFNSIQSVAMLVDIKIDYSEINSLEDVLIALDTGNKDVIMEILITSVLERNLFAEVIGVPLDNITELKIVVHNEVETTVEIEKEEPKEIQKELPIEIEFPNIKSIEEVMDKLPVEKAIITDESIRVHVTVLNDLLNMASEMVLGRNQLLRTLENYKKSIPGLAPILQNIDYLTSNMQEKIMQTRMQPVGIVFNKFPRLIRDISKSLSKEIELTIEGADVELDKSIIEGLGDPLTHLIRNCADHGLESPELREESGKSRIGTIKLKAYHEGGSVYIDVTDDGRGLNIEKIKNTALNKALLSKAELDNLSEQELIRIIFKPGFSTAEKLTDVSGRGVGMDVVKTNIEKLGGSVEIFTTAGVGTTMRLMLPLTLAIIQSLVVEVEGNRFVLPQVDVQEIVKIKKGDESRRIEFVHNSEVLRLRGKLLPIVHLADALGIQRTFIDHVTGEYRADKRSAFSNLRKTEEEIECNKQLDSRSSAIRVLIIKIGNKRFGLAVNAVLGSEETLVKPIPIYLKECECYSGVTIMGDGKTAMILDSEGIIKISALKFSDENEGVNNIGIQEANTEEVQNLLLFKCSGNEMFSVDISMVSRIEEIKYEDIESIGDHFFVKYRGTSLRVIRPEDYLLVNSNKEHRGKLYVIIPKLVSHPIGILAEKIYDNINIRLKLNTTEIKMEGIVGSMIYNNKIILVLNLYELFEKADPKNYLKNEAKLNKKSSLLLVEDTPFFQRMIHSYLVGVGYDVFLASNGREALDILHAQKVDAVVSDIQMPVMDGFELVKRIRESKDFSHMPIIAVTSMTGDYNKCIGLESGFDYYEYKLDRDKLLETIEQALLVNSGGRGYD